jgi:hypothetical protein
LWRNEKNMGHMGFYDPDTKKANSLDANLFHSPGVKRGKKIGFEDSKYINEIYDTTPIYYRYKGN